jgi:hypothetical protein
LKYIVSKEIFFLLKNLFEFDILLIVDALIFPHPKQLVYVVQLLIKDHQHLMKDLFDVKIPNLNKKKENKMIYLKYLKLLVDIVHLKFEIFVEFV